jgi:hypothetical protein
MAKFLDNIKEYFNKDESKGKIRQGFYSIAKLPSYLILIPAWFVFGTGEVTLNEKKKNNTNFRKLVQGGLVGLVTDFLDLLVKGIAGAINVARIALQFTLRAITGYLSAHKGALGLAIIGATLAALIALSVLLIMAAASPVSLAALAVLASTTALQVAAVTAITFGASLVLLAIVNCAVTDLMFYVSLIKKSISKTTKSDNESDNTNEEKFNTVVAKELFNANYDNSGTLQVKNGFTNMFPKHKPKEPHSDDVNNDDDNQQTFTTL